VVLLMPERMWSPERRQLLPDRDIRSMSFAFDLSSYDDVRRERRGDL